MRETEGLSYLNCRGRQRRPVARPERTQDQAQAASGPLTTQGSFSPWGQAVPEQMDRGGAGLLGAKPSPGQPLHRPGPQPELPPEKCRAFSEQTAGHLRRNCTGWCPVSVPLRTDCLELFRSSIAQPYTGQNHPLGNQAMATRETLHCEATPWPTWQPCGASEACASTQAHARPQGSAHTGARTHLRTRSRVLKALRAEPSRSQKPYVNVPKPEEQKFSAKPERAP